MRAVAERMMEMRKRRRERGLKELRLIVPDTKLAAVRARVAVEVARLRPEDEADALRSIEAVGEFDAGQT
jgi:putative heme degradation protein